MDHLLKGRCQALFPPVSLKVILSNVHQVVPLVLKTLQSILFTRKSDPKSSHAWVLSCLPAPPLSLLTQCAPAKCFFSNTGLSLSLYLSHFLLPIPPYDLFQTHLLMPLVSTFVINTHVIPSLVKRWLQGVWYKGDACYDKKTIFSAKASHGLQDFWGQWWSPEDPAQCSSRGAQES